MEMSIEKAIESLQILKSSWEVSLRNSLNETEREINRDIVESLAAAIDTMCKYQKIEQILSDWINNDSVGMSDYWMGRIKEVMKDE